MKTLFLLSCVISIALVYAVFFGWLKISLLEFILGITAIVFAIEFIRISFESIAKLLEKKNE
jgi:hypothetical protein